MKFWEAMKALEEGKKVRCKRWLPGHLMCKKSDNTSANDRRDFWFCIDEEWELYEEPERSLSFMEMVAALKEGKRFIRKCWIFPESWIEADTQGNVHFHDEKRLLFAWTTRDIEATDWIEVKND